ncbi:hypothetical protein PHMEG_00017030 [Phytophthora megakarya]|uniref:Eukaryotic/viral aspartic protease n=1 Tax=Phytophthora megakarya TaxID=4795 RepID=A0A225VXU2_9STRA|nr:hypothetical protein PHMEG_00017030 [Phytophthora megakarya]
MPTDPSQVPLLQTPVKPNDFSTGAFGSKVPQYMHDFHMVTTSATVGRRYALNEGSSDDGKDLLNVDYIKGNLTEKWARQMRELDELDTQAEIRTHLPLGNRKPFSCYRNKTEESMQWLRTFIYEMKRTHTAPNDWCIGTDNHHASLAAHGNA